MKWMVQERSLQQKTRQEEINTTNHAAGPQGNGSAPLPGMAPPEVVSFNLRQPLSRNSLLCKRLKLVSTWLAENSGFNVIQVRLRILPPLPPPPSTYPHHNAHPSRPEGGEALP